MTAAATAPAFSRALRDETMAAHQTAERTEFVKQLLTGAISLERYTRLVAQHHAIYSALEAAVKARADDPLARPFLDPGLARVPSIEADLQVLAGSGWRDVLGPTAATRAYCSRLTQVGEEPAGALIAHHYVRYLGDLSGGQVILRTLRKAYDIDEHRGATFYRFDAITEPAEFKRHYRELLDETPWSSDERRRIIDEVNLAYELNTAVFESLLLPVEGPAATAAV